MKSNVRYTLLLVGVIAAAAAAELEYFVDSQCHSNADCCWLRDSSCDFNDLDTGNSTLIFPGGETRCIASTSTDYAFEVYRGQPDKVLVYFQGGGSCWDEDTTAASLSGEQIFCYTDALPWLAYGAFDISDARNMYSTYTIINILYCSGDNHVGNVTRAYTDLEGGLIKQTGAANVESVLNWVEAQQKNGGLSSQLSDLVVTGCSAGSLAAQVWGNEVVRRLGEPQRSAIVLDSYAGYFPGSSEAVLMFEFGACDLYFLSEEVRSECLNQQASLSVFVRDAMAAQPNIPYMFLQSTYDQVQINYYNYVVNSAQFVDNAYDEIDEGDFSYGVHNIFESYDEYSNFLVYYVDGQQHCFTPLPYLYTASTEGYVPFSASRAVPAAGGSQVLAFDFGSFDYTYETLMKWVFRAPLLPGELLHSYCGTNGLCSSSSMNDKLYQQQDRGGAVVYSGSSSTLVSQIKALPRYDSSLKVVETDFNISKGNIDWVEYGSSIVPLPAIIYACGVFAVLLLIVITLLVTLVKTVAYHLTKSNDYTEEFYASDEGKRKILKRAFRYMNLTNTMYCLLFVAFISNVIIIVGNEKVTSGVSTTIDTLDELDRAFTALQAEADDLEILGAQSRRDLEMAEEACPAYDGLSDSLSYYDESVQYFSDAVSYVPEETSVYYDYVFEWGIDNRNAFVWVMVVILTCVVLMYAISTRYSSKWLLKCSIFFSIVIIMLSFAFAAIYMISLMLMSDFCSDPVQFTLQLAPKDGNIQAATVYYLSCEGKNPSYEYAYDADYSVRWINYYIEDVVMQDCDDQNLLFASESFDEVSDEHIPHIEDIASCETYAELWHNFVDDGVCDDLFGGIYLVWIAQTVTAICLFVCTVVGIRLIPLLEKIDQQKFRLLDDSSSSSKQRDIHDSSHHSIELSMTNTTDEKILKL